MKICMVTECFAGGVLNYLQNICNRMVQQGENVTIIYSSKSETPDNLRELFDTKIKLIEIPFKRNNFASYIKLYRKYNKLLDELNPDIIHFHSSFSGYIGRLLLKLNSNLCRKSYYTPHGYSFLKLNSKKVTRKIYLLLEKVISNLNPNTVIIPISDSEENAAKLTTKKGNIYKVLTGINTASLDNLVKETKKYTGEKVHVVSTGRLSDQKNPFMFVEIAKLCIDAGLNINFIWIGGGELEDELRKKVSEYSLDDNLQITGWLTHNETIKLMYKYSDIYVQTSLWEGLPITVLEAMYLGSCVLVKNAPGNIDPIIHNENGFICESVRGFTSKVEFVTLNRNIKERVTNLSYEHVLNNFDINKSTTNIINKYKSDLETKSYIKNS